MSQQGLWKANETAASLKTNARDVGLYAIGCFIKRFINIAYKLIHSFKNMK